MNDDGKVEIDDFTLTARQKGIDVNSPEYDEKYDINGNNVVDLPDLDYISDYVFQDEVTQLNKQNLAKFVEKTTGAAYKVGSKKVTRTTTYEYDKAGNLLKENRLKRNSHLHL